MKKKCFESFDIDYMVIGEGEKTVIELIENVTSGKDLAEVKGLGYKNAQGIPVFTADRPLMSSLDDIPYFDDTLFPMDIYLKNTGGVVQIHAQRGCPNRCTFCFNCYRVVGPEVRYRPPKNVVDEIVYLKNKYKDRIKLYAISGECITMNKKWLIAFCQDIIQRGLKIRYRVTSR
jgi:anaerobic magnesium-protoporphyrin IX monomethyl ester cyclase